MTIANTTLVLKKSGTSGNVPSTLANGELAINYADGKLFYKTPSGTIASITGSGSGGGDSFSTINVNSSLIIATSNTDTLSFSASNGISVTANTISKTIVIDGDIGVTFTQAAFNAANAAFNTANSVVVNSQTTIRGSSYLDYGTLSQASGPVIFDYGTL
jgi:hypothetical protein